MRPSSGAGVAAYSASGMSLVEVLDEALDPSEQGANAVAADFDIRGAVYVNLDGALAGVVTTAAGQSGPALRALGAYRRNQGRIGRQCQDAT